MATSQAAASPVPSGSDAEKKLRSSGSGPERQTQEEEDLESKPKKPKPWQRLGITPTMLKTMLRGSLPPLIGISMYQSTTMAGYMGTVGYLAPIVSIVSLPILPRGKYIQNLVLNVIFLLLGFGLGTLVLWSGIRARINTTYDLKAEAAYIAANGRAPYNSSQSAVAGVWLFFLIWLINLVRAKLPAFNTAGTICSIVIAVCCTTVPQFPVWSSAISLIQTLATSMGLGVALATGVSLLIFPTTCRGVVKDELAQTIGFFRKGIWLQKDFVQALEKVDMYMLNTVAELKTGSKDRDQSIARLRKAQQAGKDLRASIVGVKTMLGKVHADLPFAKREFAYGKMSGKDYGDLAKLFRALSIPVIGMGAVMDMFKRVARVRGWDKLDEDTSPDVVAARLAEQRVWNNVMAQLHEPFQLLAEFVDGGLEHAAILLELAPRMKTEAKVKDVEAGDTDPRRGDLGYVDLLRKRWDGFKAIKSKGIETWAKEKGLSSDGKVENWDKDDVILPKRHGVEHIQLLVLLYLERLMEACGENVQAIVDFAEAKVADGTMSKKHLIRPTMGRLRKWLHSVLTTDSDTTGDESPDLTERGVNTVSLGDGYAQKKDPEHLPPKGTWQHIGTRIRKISKVLGSDESSFAFRVACATLTIGIVGFLEATQVFFQTNRLVWALVIIAIGMTPTSGSSIFSFLCKTFGTAAAMVASMVVWYIVDGKTPGVIVFLWLLSFILFYFFLKFPQAIPAIILSIVTPYLIIGYELQVGKIGVEAAEKTGQPAYPVYELAPYRLATVAGACLISFIWTIFPSPYTDRASLRRDIGASLYLLGNYFGVINAMMTTSVLDASTNGSNEIFGAISPKLEKIRHQLYGKLTLLLPSLQNHLRFQKYDVNFGGKFPEAAYQELIMRAARILNYLTLMAYCITNQPPGPREDADNEWLQTFKEAWTEFTPKNHMILSTLTLLSNSMLSGQSLPPFLLLPQPYEFTRHLLEMSDEHRSAVRDPLDESELPVTSSASSFSSRSTSGTTEVEDDFHPEKWNLLDARNMHQRGYTEFAILQVCSTLIIGDLEGLVRIVSDLVGTIDYSYRVGSDESESLLPLKKVIAHFPTGGSGAKSKAGKSKMRHKGKRD